MAKKKSSNPQRNTNISFMFPSLHQDVSNAVADEIASTWFNGKKNDKHFHTEYSTNVMGKFTCNNDDCSKKGWGSKMVAILIKGYPGNGYNAVVFNQRCASCNRLGTMTLDNNSYIERVAYRLKKWAGVPTEEQHYVGKKSLPHKFELCEGCKQGYCQQRNDWEY